MIELDAEVIKVSSASNMLDNTHIGGVLHAENLGLGLLEKQINQQAREAHEQASGGVLEAHVQARQAHKQAGGGHPRGARAGSRGAQAGRQWASSRRMSRPAVSVLEAHEQAGGGRP